jgi:hypothetical protein
MADIETSVVISAQIDGLQSGMEAASSSVQAATDAMRAQFVGLGATAQQAQSQLGAAAAQIGSSIDALQARAAGLAGSIGEGMIPPAGAGGSGAAGSGAAQSGRDEIAALNGNEKATGAVYARKKAAIEASAELGRVSRTQEIAELQELLDTKWALDQDYFEKKLVAVENDASAKQKVSDEERLAYEKFLTDQQKLDIQAAQNSQKAWQSIMQPIQRAFDTSITGMILGTTTLQKAVANITQSIIGEFVNLGVKMVTNWIANELAMTTATEAWAAARTAAEGEGMAAGLAMKALNAVKSIVTDSAQAFGGIFAFLSPIMGPAAAGPAAAGEATVMAAASGIASAAGGWVVPSDQLAMVHQNEMILPAHISQGLQGMISASGGAVGGASPVVINVSAIDSQDVKRFFQSNGSLLVSAVNKAMRNGSALRTA